jgi:hypothetical protein
LALHPKSPGSKLSCRKRGIHYIDTHRQHTPDDHHMNKIWSKALVLMGVCYRVYSPMTPFIGVLQKTWKKDAVTMSQKKGLSLTMWPNVMPKWMK